WLTMEQFLAEHPDFSHGLLDAGRNRQSRLRPDEKAIRTQWVWNPGRRGPSEVLAYLRADIVALLSGREAVNPAIGRGARASKAREHYHKRARQFLRRILAKGFVKSAEVISAAAEAGIARGVLYQTKKRLRIT